MSDYMTKLDEKIKLIITHWCTDPYPTNEAHVDVAVRMIMDEIESLKAITELAVKGLKELQRYTALGYHFKTAETIAEFHTLIGLTLSEIERIQNAQT